MAQPSHSSSASARRTADAAIYWLLAIVDGLVLCAATGLYLWTTPVA